MLMGMLSLIVCGSLTGAVHRYEFHVLFRCLSAACCAQMFTAGGMICIEIVHFIKMINENNNFIFLVSSYRYNDRQVQDNSDHLT